MENIPNVITTTMIAAAGGVAELIFSPAISGKPSLGSMINGILGGLVGITASSGFKIVLTLGFSVGLTDVERGMGVTVFDLGAVSHDLRIELVDSLVWLLGLKAASEARKYLVEAFSGGKRYSMELRHSLEKTK